MTGVYPQIDLSALPAPAALDAWSFNAIVSAELSDFTARMTAAGQPYTVGSLETDPAVIVIEAAAYREGLMRQRVNDAVLATSLAYAQGTDLDVVAASMSTIRQTGESDSTLRLRAQLSWEALSMGGTYGGYRYRALTAAPVDLADVEVYGPEVAGVTPGHVRIVCLGSAANGLPSPATLAAVQEAFPRNLRKVNDVIEVVACAPVAWSVDATLILSPGADPTSVVAAQTQALNAFAASRRAVGASVSPANVEAVLGYNSAGLVYDVVVRQPTAMVGGDPFSAPILSGARIVWQSRG